MKTYLVFLFFISQTFTLEYTDNCLFAKPTVFLDYTVMESGFYSKRVIDGYVTRVLNRLPKKKNGEWNYKPAGLTWDKTTNPNPTKLILVVEKGEATRSGMKYIRCTKTKTFETMFIKITNFNSTNSLCVDEIAAIQSEQRRIFASSCFKTEAYEDSTVVIFRNNKINLPFFVTYPKEKEVFADFHHEMIKKLRDNDESDVPDPETGKIHQCKDEAWNKCMGWKDGSIEFKDMTYIHWTALVKCHFSYEPQLCQNLTQPWPGNHFPPHNPASGSDIINTLCCNVIPFTD